MMNHIEPLQELRSMLLDLRETRPASHLYVLLDNACPVSPEHPLHPEQLATRPVQRESARLVKAPGAHPDDWQPTLLQFYRAGENGYPDEALLELSLQTGLERCTSINGSYVAAWIASDLEPQVLASRLIRRCELFDTHQARRHTLALYEPHRMALLLDEPDAQMFLREFVSQTQLWLFIDAAGSLRSVSSSFDLAPEHAEVMSQHMNLPMYRSQARVPQAREVLMAIVKAGLAVPGGAERYLDAELNQTDRIGLTHPADVIFFILNNLTLPAKWHEHPQARRCIERSRDEGAPLAGLFSELSNAELDAIGRHGIRH